MAAYRLKMGSRPLRAMAPKAGGSARMGDRRMKYFSTAAMAPSENVIMAVVPDISGQLRGKGFPLCEKEQRFKTGVGWCHTCAQITSFGDIAPTPFGSLGDLHIVPDTSTEVCFQANPVYDSTSPPEHFVLSNITNTDGTPWDLCTRSYLKSTIDKLRDETGLELLVAFEHEFHYSGADETSACAYNLRAFRKVREFSATLMKNLRTAGLRPDTFMPEFAPGQCEVTVEPSDALRAADECSILREVTRATAEAYRERASFSPLMTPGGVGNGLHIHISLWDSDTKKPVTHDDTVPHKLSATASQFAAGVLKALPSLVAFTAPSVLSYHRLIPHRWSAPFNNLGYRDREASLRICPGDERDGRNPAKQTNIEFRASDASGCPHIQLSTIVSAGLQGILEELPPPDPTHQDLSQISNEELASMGIQRLPQTLSDALDNLENDTWVHDLINNDLLLEMYLKHKRHEVALMEEKSNEDMFSIYREAF
mmetsp:Transcript_20978/g.31286  ORF Transcript_20978/g.31286 Transcript_20978/m.31286 type:complete len:483 (-) Transcript_20978:30-1478(-)